MKSKIIIKVKTENKNIINKINKKSGCNKYKEKLNAKLFYYKKFNDAFICTNKNYTHKLFR